MQRSSAVTRPLLPRSPSVDQYHRHCCRASSDATAHAPNDIPKIPPGPPPKPLVANLTDINFFTPGNGIQHLYRQYNTDALRFTILGIDSCYLRSPDMFEQALVELPYATFDKTDFRPIAEWLGAVYISGISAQHHCTRHVTDRPKRRRAAQQDAPCCSQRFAQTTCAASSQCLQRRRQTCRRC